MIGWMSETLIVTSPWHLQEAQPRKVLTMLGPATDNLPPSTALPHIDLLFFIYSFHFVVYGNIPLTLDQQGVVLTPCLDKWHQLGVTMLPAPQNQGTPC